MMNRQANDEQLVGFLREDDKKAFEEIYNRYWYRLFSIAYHETGTREEAEELVHDLFEHLWKNRHEHTIRHLSSYLVVSIKHLSTNYIKSQITRRRYLEYLILHNIRQSHSTEEVIQLGDLSKLVEEVMQKLPEKTYVVFRMSRFENQSVKSIAQQLSLSEKAVEYHITQSLRVLKEQLKNYYSAN